MSEQKGLLQTLDSFLVSKVQRKERMEFFGVRLPKDLISLIDRAVEAKRFKDRSEAVRRALAAFFLQDNVQLGFRDQVVSADAKWEEEYCPLCTPYCLIGKPVYCEKHKPMITSISSKEGAALKEGVV